MSEKRGQIWIETVIYTLIGLAIIGLLLSIVKPSIEKKQDQILIESSLEMMSNIESVIEEVRYYGVGNSRNVEIKIKRGKFEFNSGNDRIEYLIESRYKYSEPDETIKVGNIQVLTTKKTETYDVSLTLKYEGLNLTWRDRDLTQTLQPAPQLYTLLVTNKGQQDSKIQIDFS